MKKEKELKKIEGELATYLQADRKSWAQTYRLMRKVRDEKLYEGRYSSFTQWVNSLATVNRYHVSTLWQRFSAGEVYSEYVSRQKTKVQDLEDIDVSPDSLALIGTITKRAKNPKYADTLVKKAVSHEMSRQDLRDINRKIRAEKQKKTAPIDTDLKKIQVAKMPTATADDIVKAFKIQKSWLDALHHHRKADFYYAQPEIPIKPGTSHHARRMDVCILENLTSPHASSDNLTIHAVEIKVSKQDLIRDHKMSEYFEYGHFFWLAVPAELVEVAKKYIAPSWGILAYADGVLRVAVEAKKHACMLAERTLAEVITHSIKSL